MKLTEKELKKLHKIFTNIIKKARVRCGYWDECHLFSNKELNKLSWRQLCAKLDLKVEDAND